MATSAQQATYAAGKGKNWAAPGEAGFGTSGYIDQTDYDGYTAANPGSAPKPIAPPPQGATVPSGPSGPTVPQNTQQVLNSAPAPSGEAPKTVTGAFQNALLRKLNAGPVTAGSESVAPAIQANQLSEQRGLEGMRAMMAERAASQGIDQNGFNSGLMAAQQQSAGRHAQYAADTVMGENRAQDQSLMALLGLTGGMLQEQDQVGLGQSAQNLQRYGMDQDADLRREGLGVQQDLGSRDLNLRGELGRGGLNTNLLGLLMNDDQFSKNLGANMGMFNANMNQRAIIDLLTGGKG